MCKSLVICDRPRQMKGQTIDEFYLQYTTYLRLHSYLNNRSTTLNNANEKELFISSLLRGIEILNLTHDERNSLDPYKVESWKQGNIVRTLENAEARLPPLVQPAQPNHQRKDIHRPRPQPRRTPPPSGAKVSQQHKLKTVNSVTFDDVAFDESDPYSVPIPDGLEFLSDARDRYVRAISNHKSFDTTRPCAACDKPGHTFEDCPVLNNIDFLKKHFIGFQLFHKRNSPDAELPSRSVNQLQTVENPTNPFDDEYNHDDPSHNEHPTEDFHQGRE